MALILDAFAQVFIEKVFALASEKISMLLHVKDDLLDLKFELEHLTNVLADAESKKIQSDTVRSWVSELREILYDADDLLDDCRMESSEDPVHPATGPRRSICSCFGRLSNKNELGKKIRAINCDLEKLRRKVSYLGLERQQTAVGTPATNRFVAPMLAEEDIVGIDEDARLLVDAVIAGRAGTRCPVNAITGMPGIGKTTLAQKISNDPQVKTHFEVTVHLCVSKDYNVVELLKEMGRCLMRKKGQEPNMKAETYNEAVLIVHQLVENTKVLLVLDDVWEAVVWEKLSFAMSLAANGSCVLVTTRNDLVAQEMKASHTHPARVLTESEGLLMLRKQVFGNEEQAKELETKGMVPTGLEIVKKCKGLPLAIKTISGMLKRREVSLREWEAVRDSPIWEMHNLGEIKPGLLLSYEDLPPHLKQCFIYCSLFPEDYRFHHQTLVQMWIAEGLIKPDGQRAPEEIADDYYRELVMRNLLQAAPEYYDGKGCTMHDLMRTLAQHVSGTDTALTRRKDRHLFFVKKDTSEPPAVSDKEYLRTFLLSKNPNIKQIPPNYFANLRHLKVLDLTHTAIKTLPESVGDLVQLRFLNVAFTKIRALPDSLGKLVNLETLKASDLKHLEALPSGITQLRRLRHIAVGSAEKQLSRMPVGIGALTSLRTLMGFVVNEDSERSMAELESLRCISHLSMYGLEKVEEKRHALSAKLEEKGSLKFLRLSCARRDRAVPEEAEMDMIEEVFQGLNPPKCLEALHIDGFFGRKLPAYIRGFSLVHLEWLRLDDCKYVDKLPPLGLLPNLKALHIWGAIAMTRIESDFFSRNPHGVSFPNLRELYLKGMTKLKKIAPVEQGVLPCLERLEVIRCPKLSSLPDGLENAGKLMHLLVKDAESMQSIEKLASVSQLTLTGNSKLGAISGLRALKMLTVTSCPDLKRVDSSDQLNYLTVVDERMRALPDWLKQITSLKRLSLKGSRELVTRCLIHGLDWALLENVPHVEVKTLDGSSYISYRKDPFIFQSNLTDGHPGTIPAVVTSEFDNEESGFTSLRYADEPTY